MTAILIYDLIIVLHFKYFLCFPFFINFTEDCKKKKKMEKEEGLRSKNDHNIFIF